MLDPLPLFPDYLGEKLKRKIPGANGLAISCCCLKPNLFYQKGHLKKLNCFVLDKKMA
jgi:hypothetical protein